MASAVGLTIVKRITYRGDATEEYSNTYWLTGSVPASNAAWKTLADALIAQEKTALGGTTMVRAYGYDSDLDSAVAVWSYDYLLAAATVAGSLVVGTGINAPGDDAVWVRWKTSRLNTKGKPIYLRKYFHPAWLAAAGGDAILAAQRTALLAFGTKMFDGSFAEARTITARGHTDTITARDASVYVTTRTLKRRGRRPTG